MSFSFLFLWTLYSSFHGQASTVAFGIIDPVKTEFIKRKIIKSKFIKRKS